ncbi:WD40-repeat-containing domain protein [Fimicolochytrium jonesii]|uniref:WD40-repeat-containing domain protein n=1 Tax=Fimicolochytrium jonesii TaxID=1396493 RepID=UPI0022FF0DC3|nr:WD40-repeat-containing domain protein [Fimicolochytrium jonesii]KAI8819605.1 WD40-repeat-containing domain protein [Fimicolochytrium jonesii]
MVTSDQVNYLIYRYLVESGFTHSTFAFQQESSLYRRNIRGSHIRPGALINLLQKGLQYAEIELHVNEDGTEKKCSAPFSLLEPHECVIEGEEKAESGRPAKRARREEVATGGRKEKKEEKRQGRGERERKAKKDARDEEAGAEVEDAAVDTVMIDQSSVSKLTHPSEVLRCSWSPTKPQFLASGGRDGKVRLWQISTKGGEETIEDRELAMGDSATAKGSTGLNGISALEWAPSGALVAAGTVDGRIFVWTRTGDLKFTEKHHAGAIIALAWSPSANFIATGSHDKMSIIWDVESGQVRQKIDFHEGPVLSADWLDDGTLATASSDNQIYVCVMGDIEPLKQFSHKGDVNKVVWDSTKKYLASCSDDGTAKIWTMDRDEPLWTAKGHSKEIVSLCWCPGSDNPIFVTAGVDRTLRLWDVLKQELLHTFTHDADVLCADFTPNGKFLASGDADGRVCVWNVKDRTLVKTYAGEKGEEVDVQVKWNAKGERLAVAAGGVKIAVLQIAPRS